MISFDNSLIRFEHVLLKSVSVALGGSIRIYDEDESEKQDKEVTIRYKIPLAVARQFQVSHKLSSFIVPAPAVVVWFGNMIVHIEKQPDGYEHQGIEWKPRSQINYEQYIVPKTKTGQWFTDGTYIYELPQHIEEKIEMASCLTFDEMFRAVTVESFKFADLDAISFEGDPVERSMVAVVTTAGDVVLTPPIWKNVLDIRASDNNVKESNYRFDLIDQHFHVNLEFALNAGRTIGEIFGYDHIGPLNLDDLMIHLNTVNLPKVPKSTRSTFGIGMSFTHAFAWVAGKLSKTTSMHDFARVRSLLKMLCQTGIFRSHAIDKIYKEDSSYTAPQMIDPRAALQHVETNVNKNDLYDFWRQGKDDDKVDQSVRNAIGAMVE